MNSERYNVSRRGLHRIPRNTKAGIVRNNKKRCKNQDKDAPVKNGRAVFRVPGLKVGVHGIKVWYSGDDKYLPGETDGNIHVLPAGDDDNHGGHPANGLEKHATGNPIWILIIAVIAMAGSGIRKFRK